MNIFDILNIPFSWILKFFYSLIPNYAVALLFLAIVLKLLLFPLGIKQQKNMVKQAALTPKTEAIRKKYAGRTDAPTQQKMNEEIMDLYKKENFNPAGGCLPMLLQFPIIISLYNVITQPLHYLCNVANDAILTIGTKIVEMQELLTIPANITLPAIEKVNTLSQINMISILREGENFSALASVLPEGLTYEALPNFFLVGEFFDLSANPSFKSWLVIIPILSALASYFGMKLTKKFSGQQQAAPQAPSMKAMEFVMPLMSLWIAFGVPAVIGIYWIYQNLLGVVQQIVLSKMYPLPTFTEEELKKIEKEMNGSKKAPKKELKKVRSLHHIDDDDYESLPEIKRDEPKKGKSENGAIAQGILKDDSDRLLK